jgi:hypothetical protein
VLDHGLDVVADKPYLSRSVLFCAASRRAVIIGEPPAWASVEVAWTR